MRRPPDLQRRQAPHARAHQRPDLLAPGDGVAALRAVDRHLRQRRAQAHVRPLVEVPRMGHDAQPQRRALDLSATDDRRGDLAGIALVDVIGRDLQDLAVVLHQCRRHVRLRRVHHEIDRQERRQRRLLDDILAREVVVHDRTGAHLEGVGQRVRAVDLALGEGQELGLELGQVFRELDLAGCEERLQRLDEILLAPPLREALGTHRPQRQWRPLLHHRLPERLQDELVQGVFLDADRDRPVLVVDLQHLGDDLVRQPVPDQAVPHHQPIVDP